MPVWTVEGADKATGQDVVRSIDAPTEELARDEAVALGILVSDIHRSAADKLDYAPPKLRNPPAQPPALTVKDVTPEYKAIRSGASLLNFMGLIYGVFGFLALLSGVLGVVEAIWARRQHEDNTAALAVVLPSLGAATMLMTCYGILRLLASLSLAMRDTARNTHEIARHLRHQSQ
jgi:hypothetical protein